MRTLTPALIAELGLTFTRPGYLVEMGFSVTQRLSTLGDISFDGNLWVGTDIKVTGIGRGDQGASAPQLSIGDPDLTWAALIGNEKVADRPVRIWSVWAGAPGDAVLEFSGIGDDAEDDARVIIKLALDSRRYAYSPRRFVGPSIGLNTLLPAGTKIALGGQTFILERR